MARDNTAQALKYIKEIYSGPIVVERPDVSGAQNKVFFVHTEYGCFVVKFNSWPLAMKNLAVSKLLEERDIPAPRISVGQVRNQWYETYPLISGQTLHQAVANGLSRQRINQVYNDILVHFGNMDTIAPKELDAHDCRYAHQVAEYNIREVNGGLVAKIFAPLVRMLNRGNDADMGVYHFDITPKNVVVSPGGQFRAFLDLDGIAICNRNFALGALASKYEQMGLQPGYLYEINDILSRHMANRDHINTVLRLNKIGKKILWQFGKLGGR